MPRLREALGRSPVVFLDGARQTGKSTLARLLIEEGYAADYLTLDDTAVRASAQADPDGFVVRAKGPLVIDEVQLVPDLLRAVKAEVDRDRRPGRFLLTGSANVLLLPKVAESLAGRMEVVTLWPFSQGELLGVRDGFVDALFETELPTMRSPKLDSAELATRIAVGGYPAATLATSEEDREAWLMGYVDTIVQRDVRELANIEQRIALPRLLSLIASRINPLVNFAELSRTSGLPDTTLRRYAALLETAFILLTVPAWSANIGKRLVRSPRMYLDDTGLAAALLDARAPRIAQNRDLLGRLLETFVATELVKQLTWSVRRPRLMHFRTHAGREVDFVLEARSGEIVGIEVKTAQAIGRGDFAGLDALREAAGDSFKRGVVLYSGGEVLRFGPELYALPLGALWEPFTA